MILLIIFNSLLICNINCVRNIYEKTHYWNLFGYDIDGIKYTSDSDFEYNEGSISFDDVELKEHEKFLIRKNLVPNHVTFSYDVSIVSIPRTRPGIPFTVNTMNTFNFNKNDYSPLLRPYPSARVARDIVSVYETAEDGCQRLWFVDTGYLDMPGMRKQVAPPRIFAFEKNTKFKIYKGDISSNVLRGGITAGLRSLTIDYIFPCHETFVYISDDNGNAVIAFSFEIEQYWRIERQSTGGEAWSFPIPQSILVYVENVIRHRKSPNETFIHYSNILRSTKISQRLDRDTSVDLSERDTNPRGVLYDRNYDNNILFFTNEDRTNLYCWNMDTAMDENNIQFLTGISSDNGFYISAINTDGLTFYIMVNRYTGSTDDVYNENHINFADYTATIEEMLRNTKCIQPTNSTYFINNWRIKIQGSVGSPKYMVKYVTDEYIESQLKGLGEGIERK
ncbi:L-dopachrome tautomerase yellow-f2 isoform X1 [Bombyx mori]|uniref:Uncharacterized protein n=1 Tax=Bombyx mori TaxID=7091 RepID=A0A8R2M3D6_BOMMO|nr:L-dopachrome tautomerase yellow-f2 [Bombyx mori]